MDNPGLCWSWACGESMLEHMRIAGYGGGETALCSQMYKPETKHGDDRHPAVHCEGRSVRQQRRSGRLSHLARHYLT